MVKEIDIDKIFKGTIAIHLTDLFPKKKWIRTRFSTNPLTWFRDTVHFSLNQPAQDLDAVQTSNLRGAVWSDKTFAILIPFDKLYKIHGKYLQSFTPDDTFFRKSVPIPDGSLILVMPAGIPDALHNNIITQQELYSSFGSMDGHLRTDEVFFEKKHEGIMYRIFSYWEHPHIKECVVQAITQLGYAPNFFYDKPLRQINEALGLGFEAHDTHWTKYLEDLRTAIHILTTSADHIPSVLAKAAREGIMFPIHIKEYALQEEFVDATGKTFSLSTLKGLTQDEKDAAECLEWSIIKPEYAISTLQRPIRVAQALLKNKEIPYSYHNAIKFYIKDYQKHVKKKLPKEIILLCPRLSELLDQKF